MRKRVWLAVAIVGVALLTGLLLLMLRSEPSYQGRRLTSWIEDLSTARLFWNLIGVAPTPVFARYRWSQANAESAAQQAVRHIGTNGLPKLVQLIRHDD